MTKRPSALGNKFFLFFILIVLFVSPLKVPLVKATDVQLHRRLDNFAILFENNLILRTSQQCLIKWAWAFSQPVAASTVSHPGA